MDQTASSWAGNIISAGAIITSFMGWVPGIAAIVALVWYVIQISESQTVQRWFLARRQRKLASLRAKLLKLEGSEPLALPPPAED